MLDMAESVLESLTQEYKAKTNKLYNIQQVTKFSLNFTFYLKAKIHVRPNYTPKVLFYAL